MSTRRVSARTGVDEEVCAYIEFGHYDPGADTGNGKKN